MEAAAAPPLNLLEQLYDLSCQGSLDRIIALSAKAAVDHPDLSPYFEGLQRACRDYRPQVVQAIVADGLYHWYGCEPGAS
jgi:hypothetical protein